MKKTDVKFQHGENGEVLKLKNPQSYVIAEKKKGWFKKNDTLVYAQYICFKSGGKVDYENDLSIRQTTFPWRGDSEMKKKYYPVEVVFSDSIGNTLILRKEESMNSTTYSSGPSGTSSGSNIHSSHSDSEHAYYKYIFVHGDEYVETLPNNKNRSIERVEWLKEHLAAYPEVQPFLDEVIDHYNNTGLLMRSFKQNEVWQKLQGLYITNYLVQL